MTYYIFKVLVSSVVIVAVAEIAKRSSFFGALVASLPLTSLLAFLWLYRDTSDSARVAQLSYQIFWLVIPSLVLFLVFPWLVRRGFGFWSSLGLGVLVTVLAYFILIPMVRRLGVNL
jgi:uncharacterized membrane protein (GlpM family)